MVNIITKPKLTVDVSTLTYGMPPNCGRAVTGKKNRPMTNWKVATHAFTKYTSRSSSPLNAT